MKTTHYLVVSLGLFVFGLLLAISFGVIYGFDVKLPLVQNVVLGAIMLGGVSFAVVGAFRALRGKE